MDGMFSMLGGTPSRPSSSKQGSSGSTSKRDKSKGKKRPALSASGAAVDDSASDVDEKPPKKKGKAKATDPIDPMEALEQPPQDGFDTSGDVDHSRHNPALAEKAMPVVADDFEQEAEREVAATTGFAAAAAQEGEKMKLVHQVCIPV
jgi:ATP-dependent RNA helicase DOB1